MGNSIFMFSNQLDTATLTASSAALPVTNLTNPQRSKIWRSTSNTAWVSAQLDAANGADYLAIVDLNLSTSGMIRVRAWLDAVDGSELEFDQYYDPNVFSVNTEVDVDYGLGDYGLGAFGTNSPISATTRKNVQLLPFGQTLISPFYKIDFMDENVTYVQAGVLFLAKARVFEINLSYDWNIRQIDRSVSKESIAGQRYIQPRDTRLEIRGKFGALSEAERTDMIVQITEVGNTRPIIYSVFPLNNNVGLTTTIYGSFTDSDITNKFENRNEFSFTVTEEL
jgi:hypothetical protein